MHARPQFHACLFVLRSAQLREDPACAMPQPSGRSLLPCACNPLSLNVALPATPRSGHPLLAPPRPILGRPSGAAQPTVLAALSPSTRPQLQVFDLSALPSEAPRTPRAPVAPLLMRRRQPFMPEYDDPTIPVGLDAACISPPSPPMVSSMVGASVGHIPLAPPAPASDSKRLKQAAIKPEMRQIIRSRSLRTPRWQTPGDANALRAIGLAAL